MSISRTDKHQEQQDNLWFFQRWWYRNTPSKNVDEDDENSSQVTQGQLIDDSNKDVTGSERMDSRYGNWYSTLTAHLPELPFFNKGEPPVEVNSETEYSELSVAQINFLESEAKNAISQRLGSWCWYDDLSTLEDDPQSWPKRPGVMSVSKTGSALCPLPMPEYPAKEVGSNSEHLLYVRNTMLLPSRSPLEIYHEQPLRSKISSAVRDYYNFPNETHLYLKKHWQRTFIQGEKVVIISCAGWLPGKYEKVTISEQRSPAYLSKMLAKALKRESPAQILSLSFESPLDSESTNTVLAECIELLKNFKHLFCGARAIFFVGVYHSVPLVLALARYILEEYETMGFSKNTYIGVLGIESCLGGYRFWDHSLDQTSNKARDTESSTLEDEYRKIQQAKERQLTQGLSKNQQQILTALKEYRMVDSDLSRTVQQNIDWLVYNWDSFRLSLVGKLYDNFLTVSQKLAIDYVHPKILRNVWCDANHLEIDLKNPENSGVPNRALESPTASVQLDLKIPESRIFELLLVDNFLLALNLGKREFVSILKLVSPFFISRSFNENTIITPLRRSKQVETKTWLQQMDTKWQLPSIGILNSIFIGKPTEPITDVFSLLELAHYHSFKNPEKLQLLNTIYDDSSIYDNFVANTLLTRKPLTKGHLTVLKTALNPTTILSTVNQYDLVWKLHESLSNFIQLRNIPHQRFPKQLQLTISTTAGWETQARNENSDENYDDDDDDDVSNYIYTHTHDETRFKRTTEESRYRLRQMWERYQSWDPPTRGLIHLKGVLSVLSSYNSAEQLIDDLDTGR